MWSLGLWLAPDVLSAGICETLPRRLWSGLLRPLLRSRSARRAPSSCVRNGQAPPPPPGSRRSSNPVHLDEGCALPRQCATLRRAATWVSALPLPEWRQWGRATAKAKLIRRQDQNTTTRSPSYQYREADGGEPASSATQRNSSRSRGRTAVDTDRPSRPDDGAVSMRCSPGCGGVETNAVRAPHTNRKARAYARASIRCDRVRRISSPFRPAASPARETASWALRLPLPPW
jgi:hypothetical protein